MNREQKASLPKRIASITLHVLSYVFFAICAIALFLSITAKRDSDGAATVFNTQLRVVLTNSMEKCNETDVSAYAIKDIPTGSMVFVELMPEEEAARDMWYASLRVGDVLTFRYVYARQVTITHRIVDITPKPTGGYLIYLEGDNKASDSELLKQVIDTSQTESPNYVIGKVVGKSYFLGLLVTALKSPVGIVCIVIIPCAIIAIYEIFRLAMLLTEKRKQREREESQKRDEELEEMKKQLALLQQKADMLQAEKDRDDSEE